MSISDYKRRTIYGRTLHFIKQQQRTAVEDMAESKWDEVMTDALYSFVWAKSVDEMRFARECAEGISAEQLEAA